jgi:5S rRNA maturation endonuclease (ribonuclease M5)
MTATAYDRLLDRLREIHKVVKTNGRPNQAKAQCPAHDDRNPSLSITGIEGQVLVHCHTGCPVEAVLDALGLTKRDLFDDHNGVDYRYEDGRNAHRTWDKRFWQTGNTNGHGTTQLYRLTEVKSAVFDSKTIWLVEGEKDCHAIEVLGEVATTAPMGATNFHKVDASPLRGAKIKAIVDKDDRGEEWAKQVRDKLDGQAETVEFYQAKIGKDAADHIAAGYGLDDFESVGSPGEATALRLVEAVDVIISRVRFLWANRIPLGAFTLIPGEEGVGKTTINTWIIANVTKGTLPGKLFGQPRHVIIIAPEDHREAVVTPRLKEAGADLKLVTFIDARIFGDSEHPIVIPRDLDEIARLCRKRNTALVVIDSFVTTLPETMKSISYKDTATVLKALGVFAETTNVAVLAPWHLNKAGGSDTALRMMDSRGFRTAARSILLAVGDPEKHGEVIVALDKANGASLDTPAVRFRIDTASYTVEEIDEQTGEVSYIPATCSVATLIREEAGNGRDLARRLLTPAMERGNDPKKWLRQYLTETGPCLRDQIMEAAKEAGFGEKKIQRAAGKLRVVYRDHTIKRPNNTPLRKVEWSLPDDDAETDSDGEDTSPSRSSHSSPTVLTVLTAAQGRGDMSLSSLVRSGEDGQDGQEEVRKSVLTDKSSVLTDSTQPEALFPNSNVGPSCGYWTDGNYCGDANTRRYMNGWRCVRHTPAAIRGGVS